MSPAQEFWIYSHLKRREILEMEQRSNMIKTICSFINPKMAKEVFDAGEVSENSGFMDDLKAIDPNFKSDDYADVLEAMN